MIDRFRGDAGTHCVAKNHPHPAFSREWKSHHYNVNSGKYTQLRVP